MVKNWADHCSSDEEEEIADDHQQQQEQAEDSAHPSDPEEPAAPAAQPRPPRTYEFPTEPPFTAYVGNLAYSVDTPARLQDEITGLAKQHLDLDVRVIDARVAMDRRGETPRHRGFGYVQLETLEELQLLMQLNEKEGVVVAGRKIQVDTANRSTNAGGAGSHRKAPAADVDGTKFRGGRYNNKDNKDARGSRRGNNRRDQHQDNNDNKEGAPPQQRVSLKLQPRSKPRESEEGGLASDIFGSGRARNDQTWHERKKIDQPSTTKEHSESHADDERKGNRHHTNNNDNRRSSGGRGVGKERTKNKQEKPAAPVVPPQAKAEPPKQVTKVSNSFAALGFEDSDSD